MTACVLYNSSPHGANALNGCQITPLSIKNEPKHKKKEDLMELGGECFTNGVGNWLQGLGAGGGAVVIEALHMVAENLGTQLVDFTNVASRLDASLGTNITETVQRLAADVASKVNIASARIISTAKDAGESVTSHVQNVFTNLDIRGKATSKDSIRTNPSLKNPSPARR